ncbi:hypothetical protein HYALB_00013610 [Hymenoscyphus albidus]|uniref:MYND-type domain-containing protein n=1 Tax=Hymenoscyphus albidus TaxID=595503 RepID=A0A9N9LVZ9_9HELO|nr:hypothetical protein HYALB_00013610 [Hymenoscyphus albidus]
MATPRFRCVICNTTDAKRRSSCLSTAYCSHACQKKDWPLHKTICKDFTTTLESPPPSPRHILAIHLPVSSPTPTLVWVALSPGGSPGAILSLPSDPEADRDCPGTESVFITSNKLRNFNLANTVAIKTRCNFLYDESPRNECVWAQTKGAVTYDWRGPMAIMRMTNGEYIDVKPEDLRTVVDWMVWYMRDLK